VLDPDVVWLDYILLGAVAKQTDDRRMGAAQDSNDAAFRTLRTANTAQTYDLGQNVIAVHGVSNSVARDENIAVELRHRRIRHDEPVAVVVLNQPPFYFIATRESAGFGGPRRVLGRLLARRLLFRLAAREAVSSPRQFFDSAALLELGKHFKERALVTLFQVEPLDDLTRGRGFAPNL
jgi:hypothetical protein